MHITERIFFGCLVFLYFFCKATFISVFSWGEMEDSAVEHIPSLLPYCSILHYIAQYQNTQYCAIFYLMYFRYLHLYQSQINCICHPFCVFINFHLLLTARIFFCTQRTTDRPSAHSFGKCCLLAVNLFTSTFCL